MELDPQEQRRFAVEVVSRLVEAGFTAYWAGGCVRDQLLGRTPKDYDVATSALPDQVRQLFGRRRTHAVGAAFGVITVVGPQRAGHVEVATFRRDVAYSDGRHPDSIEFSSPVDDASRRDFTINGLFFDPLKEEVVDLVGGRADLEQGVVRAIGDARARFTEDKLRMLRAARFAATFDFQIDPATADAIADMAAELPVVSAERIAQEMRLLLVIEGRARAMRLLRVLRLLNVVLPELSSIGGESSAWDTMLKALAALDRPSFPLALATALCAAVPVGADKSGAAADEEAEPVRAVCRRWKLSNREEQRIVWLVRNQSALWDAPRQPWPKLQRILIEPGIDELLALHAAWALGTGRDASDLEICRERLAWSPDRLNPPPLVNGHDLIAQGLAPGASFHLLLERIRDEQLEGRIATPAEALALASRLLESESPLRDRSS